MKEAMVKIVKLENKADVDAYRASSVGNMVLPVGSVLISACVSGSECGTQPFIPNKAESGVEQAAEWIDLNVLNALEKKGK